MLRFRRQAASELVGDDFQLQRKLGPDGDFDEAEVAVLDDGGAVAEVELHGQAGVRGGAQLHGRGVRSEGAYGLEGEVLGPAFVEAVVFFHEHADAFGVAPPGVSRAVGEEGDSA
ncbi:MAG: hypothetical protein CL885_00005, partial [Dehalococcoidia bacterium]|nr:hypothetical protein [Dehalococcoidia bacterium]